MSIVQDLEEFAEYRLRDSTGREWLVRQVRAFLADVHAPPFLLIVGEPGIGKSAFAAYLGCQSVRIIPVHVYRAPVQCCWAFHNWAYLAARLG
jgi:hypothetical protein